MEARSLTALNNLAANPPPYPLNPAEARQDPLTLYISRVPGTRDVILSPFKPQQKIVSAEDVASSLYYIHMERPFTDLTQPPPVRDDGFGSSSDEGSARNIPRKPLPRFAEPPTTSDRDLLPVPGKENQNPIRPRGHTVNSTFENPLASPPQPEPAAPRRSLDDRGSTQRADWTPIRRHNTVKRNDTISRKPLGARPMPSPGAPRQDKPLPAMPISDGALSPIQTSNPRQSFQATRPQSPKKRGEPAYTNPFTLALIRRDPSTGNQWNVAHVSSYQTETIMTEQDEAGPLFAAVPPLAQTQNPAANPPINLQIETLGYGKFRQMPVRKSFDIGPGDGIPEDAKVPRNDGVIISRQVLMSYAKTWSTNFREKWNQDGFGQGRGEHSRNGSVGSMDSTGSGETSPGPQTSLGHPLPGMRPRGYVFTSPWNGRCEFRTGTTGRSLRCYHVLSDDKSSFNALIDQHGIPVPVAPQTGAYPMSELRFNLPSRELFKTAEGREEVKTQLQGHFNKLLQRFDNRPEQSDEDDGIVSPFDVNLGKEKAGGGKHGKRAKLGKLIIYPDGLKMLDMLVAANMGVWWGAWERSF